jgi:hypothetical protein
VPRDVTPGTSWKENTVTSRRPLALVLALALSLGTAAPSLAATPTGTPAGTATATEAPAAPLTDAEQALLEEFQRAWAGSDRVSALTEALSAEAVGQQCARTGLNLWLDSQRSDWSARESQLINGFSVQSWAAFEAFVLQPDGPQHFGVDGEHTKELQKTLRTLRTFWDVDGSDVQLGAIHGTVILDDSRMVPLVYELLRGQLTLAQVQQVVDMVQGIVQQEKFDHGNHPALSFSAMAYSDGNGPASGLPDKILIGDGLLEGMTAVGLGDVAPRGILAHEYGHQVQYELGLFDHHAGDAEATRQTELEADALAAYYLSHPRGERLRQDRVDAFVRSFGETGDCNDGSGSHHGTPVQRAAAARWGDELANSKGAKGHVLPARTVSDRFRAALPQLLTAEGS